MSIIVFVVPDSEDPEKLTSLLETVRRILPSTPVEVHGGSPSAPTASSSANGASAPAPAAAKNKGGRPPKAATPPAGNPLADDVAGPVDPDDDEGDALGLAQPSLSPQEAHEKGLIMARELLNKGQKVLLKELQQQMGIAKFTDIPITDGPKLYMLAKGLCEKAGIAV